MTVTWKVYIPKKEKPVRHRPFKDIKLDVLAYELRRRGWEIVPTRYAEEAFPEQVRTGCWPRHHTEDAPK